jgi:hypothetical protein
VDDISFTVLVDHVKEISVSKEVNVDHIVVIRQVILVNFGHLFHFIIQYRDPVAVADVFID